MSRRYARLEEEDEPIPEQPLRIEIKDAFNLGLSFGFGFMIAGVIVWGIIGLLVYLLLTSPETLAAAR